MARNIRQNKQDDARKPRRSQHSLPDEGMAHVTPRTQAAKKPIQAMTPAQAEYMKAIRSKDLILCRGPMGTGKTYIAASLAADALRTGQIDKIIITRPAVEAGEELGILPGEIGEKWAPYFAPVKVILEERLGAGHVEMFIKNGKIEIAPIGHLRGHTFKDCWVLFDEAQNSTPKQMKLVLTRIGENCKMIVDGDPDEQMDIAGLSGFEDAWRRMSGHPQTGFVAFGVDDIVRSGISRDILLRYRSPLPAPSSNTEGATVGQAELFDFLGNRAD